MTMLLPSALATGCSVKDDVFTPQLVRLFTHGVVPMHRKHLQVAEKSTLQTIMSSDYVEHWRFGIVLHVFQSRLPSQLLKIRGDISAIQAQQLSDVVEGIKKIPGLRKITRLACEDVCLTFIGTEEGKNAIWGRPYSATGKKCASWDTYDKPYA